ncbi:LacI family DNA-binding transcriptional regulator [Glycomyces paridis]|uniref:LacI family transcriptional regulator n=1 Tax=Glycomyces paridis TaxID=2126555 RepID=A0A4S8PGL4_9ACTN|nr:LacI family DNA-binding transcriptional regulator [Glycomyces paridis]THV28745.1 LacI family transcriptional regulator [Glycomyces paridis]
MDGSGRSAPKGRVPATIYDVARATGVSPSTVSRALNKPGRLSAATEQRIREAAAELGYRMNPMARALPTGKTGTLGLLVSDLTNPVYFDLVRGAERIARENGATLIFADSQESSELERDNAERLQVAVDGLLLVASRLDDAQIQELASVKPLVAVNRLVSGVSGVVPDVSPGMTEAINLLHRHGHRRIAYLAGPEASWMNGMRRLSVFDLAEDKGMTIVEIQSPAPTRDGGTESYPLVKAANVTAVLAYNDLVALGLLRACRAHGVDVPGDLSVVGFDDIFGADLPTPALTTVRSPMSDMGMRAVRMLLAVIEGEAESTQLILPTEFVNRESTAAPRR